MALAKFKFPLAKADELWKLVLLNQFHDIIPGSSIHRVYERNLEDLGKVLDGSAEIDASAKASLCKASKSAVSVFNSLSWERDALVKLPFGVSGLEGVPTQSFEGADYALVDALPSCGWAEFKVGKPGGMADSKAAVASGKVLENALVRAEFNDDGEIVSMLDKASGREFVERPCNHFRLFKDVPSWFDAWDVDSMYKMQELEISSKAKMKVLSKGPLLAALRIEREIGESTLTQDVVLRAGSRRIDFVTKVDWKESHKMLKVAFPVNVKAEDALHEIQFGHVRRPTHASKPYDFHRFEVCNHKWSALVEEGRGAAVLNDCKYGVGVEGSNIGLTLLRSPLAPDMSADKGSQEFTYSFMVWDGAFKDGGLVREGYDLNVPRDLRRGGPGGVRFSPRTLPAWCRRDRQTGGDGSGDIVVRLYEALRTRTECSLSFGFPVKKAQLCDMLENASGELKLLGGAAKLEFKPFEIKTLRLKV
jgi:alpha-mannosidase